MRASSRFCVTGYQLHFPGVDSRQAVRRVRRTRAFPISASCGRRRTARKGRATRRATLGLHGRGRAPRCRRRGRSPRASRAQGDRAMEPDERVEAALGADVPVGDVGDVVRGRGWAAAKARTSAVRHVEELRRGVEKRRMSHGHAMRSIFGRSRVTHRVGACHGPSEAPPRASRRGRRRRIAR